jgi:hypothetical protein
LSNLSDIQELLGIRILGVMKHVAAPRIGSHECDVVSFSFTFAFLLFCKHCAGAGLEQCGMVSFVGLKTVRDSCFLSNNKLNWSIAALTDWF